MTFATRRIVAAFAIVALFLPGVRAHAAGDIERGSADGPLAGKPIIVGSGMQGDRAAVIFSRPEEVSAFIRRECP